MSTPFESTRSFRFSHDAASAVFGVVAAAAAIVFAGLVFGPLADRKVVVMSGGAVHAAPNIAAASAPLHVASSDRVPAE